MNRIALSAGRLTLELAPEVGGSIAAFRLDRTPLMREAPAVYDEVLQAACFPLTPFSNRVRDGRFAFDGRQARLTPNLAPQRHPLHGQGWRSPWRTERADGRSALLSFDHAAGEWPWAYRAEQAFDLDEGGLTLALSTTNLDDGPMPCGLGLHPYFPSDPETVLDVPVEGVLTVDYEIMPVERALAEGRYALADRRIDGAGLDNGYDGWTGRAVLRRNGIELVTTAERDRGRGLWFQVYAPVEGGIVCAEPVTHANAAFDLPPERWEAAGLVILRPGERFTLTTRFEATISNPSSAVGGDGRG